MSHGETEAMMRCIAYSASLRSLNPSSSCLGVSRDVVITQRVNPRHCLSPSHDLTAFFTTLALGTGHGTSCQKWATCSGPHSGLLTTAGALPTFQEPGCSLPETFVGTQPALSSVVQENDGVGGERRLTFLISLGNYKSPTSLSLCRAGPASH